jgi:hypothetical protein
MSALAHWKRRNEQAVAEWQSAIVQSAPRALAGFDLESFLIMPVQRIPRYGMSHDMVAL